jgi:hypothetical protein
MTNQAIVEHSAVKAYGYRWVVLAVWMFVNILMQALMKESTILQQGSFSGINNGID